jgi:hypothetical protein
MDGFGAGYFVGRRKEQRKNARVLAAQRDQMEREIRAQYGLPPPSPTTRAVPVVTARPLGRRVTGRLVRRVVLAMIIMALLFVAIFAVYAIGYGVQHHLIYPMPSR